MADPLADVLPRSLPDVSRELGIAPLEVVRLCGLVDVTPPSGWALDPRVPERLAQIGGIELRWDHASGLGPLDRIRAVLGRLAERNLRGDRFTRIDNTWRGLPADEQLWIERALTVLADSGHLHVEWRPEGRVVALAASPSQPLQAFLDGGDAPPELAGALART